jgi:mannose-6-phosphate isomerase-like protein (cupin superfamily)
LYLRERERSSAQGEREAGLGCLVEIEPPGEIPVDADVDVADALFGRIIGGARSAFVIAEWSDPGNPPGPPNLIAPLHVHHRDDEAWYVLEGALRFRLGDREVEAPAGSAVFAPRGTPHTYWNPHQEPARYLIVMSPNILGLIDGLHALSQRDAASVRTVFSRHDSVVLGDG